MVLSRTLFLVLLCVAVSACSSGPTVDLPHYPEAKSAGALGGGLEDLELEPEKVKVKTESLKTQDFLTVVKWYRKELAEGDGWEYVNLPNPYGKPFAAVFSKNVKVSPKDSSLTLADASKPGHYVFIVAQQKGPAGPMDGSQITTPVAIHLHEVTSAE